MKRIGLIGAALLGAATAFAQEEPDLSHSWSLEECTRWALEHNLTIKRQELNEQQREIDLNTAQNAYLPSVSGSASENLSFGRGLTADNTYANTNTTSTSFSIGAGMNLFDGLATARQIEMGKLNLEAATADLQKAREDIRVAVAQAYVQILYNQEILDVAREQIRIDSLQVERLVSMASAGKASAAEVAQQKASLAQSRTTLVQAENSLRLSLLELSRLLEFPYLEGFHVVRPEVSVGDILLPRPEDIYADAVAERPSIRAEKLRLESSQTQLKLSRSALYPTLSLNGGLGTNYYTASSGFVNQGFWDQLTNNFSQYVGLSLNIPIFNRFSTRNNIRSAELSLQGQQIQLEQAQQSLYKEIMQAWNNAVAAQAKYNATEAAASSTEEAFRLVTAKYENGKASITEFNESRNQFLRARSDLAQATYEYLFQSRLLNFYRTGIVRM